MCAVDTRITILVDNKAAKGLAAEHGLSLWIEAGGKKILYDTGQGSAFESNLQALGVDLSAADFVVLSHGHYDHTGGLAHVLAKAPGIPVYCHPAVTRPRYVIRDGQASSVGMPPHAAAALARMSSERLHWVREPIMLSPGVGLTGPIPRHTDYEDTGGPFFLDPQGKVADPLEDDLALWVDTGQGLVVCLGCCHAGLVNTLDHIGRLASIGAAASGAVGVGAAGPVRLRALIGGLHLVNASKERLERTIACLEQVDPELVVACHCSGESAVAALRDAIGERVVTGAGGMRLSF